MRKFAKVSSGGRLTRSNGQALLDSFIHKHSPEWIKGASAQDIALLQTLISGYKASREAVSTATEAMMPVHTFAERTYGEALKGVLPAGHALGTLEWRDKVLQASGLTTPHANFTFQTRPGLLRLMQNFAAGSTPLEGSGLYAPGTGQLLSGGIDAFTARCRRLDAGAQYQALLKQYFAGNKALLIDDARAGFRLAVHIALLRKQIDADVGVALNAFALASSVANDSGNLVAYPGLLSMLGNTVHDALLIQLRGADDADKGVVIYRPADPDGPLRWYASKLALEQAVCSQIRAPGYLNTLLESVALGDRQTFWHTLQLRLKDTVPDLQVEGETGGENVFEHWVGSQLERATSDARLLLVPTAEADAKARRERLDDWVSLGWGAANLGGFFIPAVGALLLADLVKHVCAKVYEGVGDWAKGHDHEALEHLLNVAQTLAAAAVTTGTVVGAGAAVRRFTRSAFVDGMEVVSLDDGTLRLWHDDLSAYQSPAENAVLDDNGLYSRDDKHWLRIDNRDYQLRQAKGGRWRLVHPLRENAYGPVVQYNGERYWHLASEAPQSWTDAAMMLGRLWPQTTPLDLPRAQQVLQAAGSDVEELRGILVENRKLPANLRDTLRRFEADRRVEDFFKALEPDTTAQPEPQLLQWCRQYPGIAEVDAEQVPAEIRARAPHLRQALFVHLSSPAAVDDKVAQVVMRDFTGLPPDYAFELSGSVTADQRNHIELLGRLPLPVAQKARSLSQLARLSRAQQGVMLRNAYTDESGELALQLLTRLDHWSLDRRLELRANSATGRLIAVLKPQARAATAIAIARSEGEFGLYDHRGVTLDHELEAPDDFFAAIAALLPAAQRTRLELGSEDPAGVLREKALSKLPRQRQKLLNLLGWRESPGWFNPGRRLADGRVGYELGGRHSSEMDLTDRLRWRLTMLYRGDSVAQVEEHLARILDTEDAFETLIYEENNYQLLCDKLNVWIAEAPEQEKPARGLMATRLRQAWRRQLDVDSQHQDGRSRVLDLSGFQVTSLPRLDETLDFHFVTTLIMVNTPVMMVPESFFSCFTSILRLNLSRNQLRAVPSGLRHLSDLEDLQLNCNRIGMDTRGQDILNNLPQLTELHLSDNPLRRIALGFVRAPALRRLSLRHCGLSQWPAGLEQCVSLDVADLCNNLLATIPDAILNMPYGFRSALRIEGNAISVQQRTRLYEEPPHGGHWPQGAEQASEMRSAREIWVSGVRAVEVGGFWDRLFAVTDADRTKLKEILQKLQDTEDYENHRHALTLQVWTLLEYMDKDPVLRDNVLITVRDPLVCPDSVAERFSDIYLQAMRSKALHAEDNEEEALLKLGLGMFRLSKLQEFVTELFKARAFPDPLETKLYFNVQFAKEFDLPGQPASMKFADWAHVSATDIAAAREFVVNADEVDGQVEFLSGEAYWCGWVEKKHPVEFQQLLDRHDEAGLQLAEKEGTMTTEAYQQQWFELDFARTVERRQLIKLFTRQILEPEPVDA